MLFSSPLTRRSFSVPFSSLCGTIVTVEYTYINYGGTKERRAIVI